MEQAPFYTDVARAPEGAAAWWIRTPDAVRLRVALLAPPPAPCRGTVLLFNGRTEYVEKYGDAAAELRTRGFACLSLDWRGQGLSDRPLDDPATGHVERFSEFQIDVGELTRAARSLDLPRPWYLLGHSMGGGIGLRALHSGLEVDAAAFSGPMWGIALPSVFKPVAELLAALSRSVGFGHSYAFRSKPRTYVDDTPFEGNTLTTDPEMYRWMRNQVRQHPDLALGGPSMTWLNEALKETRNLRALPAPDVPCTTWFGSNERIVDIDDIRSTMARWKNGVLHEVPDGEHELMMESPEIRTAFFDAVAAQFGRN